MFPADFYEQAVRDKLTFSCKEDTYKLKLYDEGAALLLEKAVKILSLEEATNRELQESKTAEIESVTPRRNRSDFIAIKLQNKRTSKTLRGSPSKRVAETVVIATADMPLEGGTAQLRIYDAESAIK